MGLRSVPWEAYYAGALLLVSIGGWLAGLRALRRDVNGIGRKQRQMLAMDLEEIADECTDERLRKRLYRIATMMKA